MKNVAVSSKAYWRKIMIKPYSDYFEKYAPLSKEAKISIESIPTHISLLVSP